MTRGMLVTVLYRLAVTSVQGLENPFYDVSLNRYYRYGSLGQRKRPGKKATAAEIHPGGQCDATGWR